MEETVRGGGGGSGGRVEPSLETGADYGGRRGVNQSHVDPLRAVLWADDLGQTFGPRLAQQLTCNTTRTGNHLRTHSD